MLPTAPLTSAPRHLYVARHAEATPDGTALTDTGRHQATLLGQRLRDVPLAAIHHGPLGRATETARLVAEQLGRDVRPHVHEAAGDYVPYEPVREDFPTGIDADRYLDFVARIPAEERRRGPELAARATELFTGPVERENGRPEGPQAENDQAEHGRAANERTADERAVNTGRPSPDEVHVRHELVVTHNFLAAWFVRAAYDAPAWRWMGTNLGNAALTVIRYAPGRPAAVLLFNDMSHLPTELRWTGYPTDMHV